MLVFLRVQKFLLSNLLIMGFLILVIRSGYLPELTQAVMLF